MIQVKVMPSAVLATCHVLYGTHPSYPDIFPKEGSRILDPREQQLPHRMPRGFLEGTGMGWAESKQPRQSRVADRQSSLHGTLHAQTRDRKQLPGSKQSWTVPTRSWVSPRLAAEWSAGYFLAEPGSQIQINRSLFPHPQRVLREKETLSAVLEFRPHFLPTTLQDSAIPTPSLCWHEKFSPGPCCSDPPCIHSGAAEKWI